ncbi:hypothetical protein [Pseudomonas corrugata]|uniref:hypothetical protein n=1 Tax=Pseudomonas corrugata TaxID=47879 RepID=UPI0015861D92|nr:hypothetical protein [Pseudomonas corrugata]MCI0995635.1 hypothetical protein [Pseudomonas corrugata]NUT64686.1 hypothetical protein [Pseudomonas corrugata]
MNFPAPPEVAGYSLAGHEPYVISAKENRELCRTLGVEPAEDGTAHPIYYFIATQIGMGVSVAGLCAACEFDVDDGPMMGASRTEFSRPLRTDQAYQVSGEILSLVRKPSRTFGVMDVLDYQLNLRLADGTPVLVTTNTWVLPRRNLV